jgi:hypothetical protein
MLRERRALSEAATNTLRAQEAANTFRAQEGAVLAAANTLRAQEGIGSSQYLQGSGRCGVSSLIMCY